MTHHWGYMSAVASALLFGISSTLSKIALENVHPTLVAGMIYFIGGVFLFGIHFSPLSKRLLEKFEMFGRSETELKITSKDLRVLAFVIICGPVVAPLLFMNGLNQTTAINASLLLNAESLFTAWLAFVLLSERGTKKEYLGIALLLFGVVFVTTNGDFRNLP